MRASRVLPIAAAVLLAAAGALTFFPRSVGRPDPYLLSEFPIDGPLVQAIERSRQRADEAERAGRLLEGDARAAFLLAEELSRAPAREAAADSFFARWRRDPGDFYLIDLMALNAGAIGRPDALGEVLAGPAFADTAGIPHRYYSALSDQWVDSGASLRRFLGIAAAPSGLAPAERSLLSLRIAETLSEEDRCEEALDTLLAGVQTAAARGGMSLEAFYWSRMPSALHRLGRLAEALHAGHHAIRLLERCGLQRRSIYERTDAARVLADLGRPERTFSLLHETAARAESLGMADAGGYALNRLSTLYIDMGELRAALRIDQRVARALEAAGDSANVPLSFLNIADDRARLGELDSALAAIDSAKAWASAYRQGYMLWAVHTDESEYWLLNGDFRRADSLARLAGAGDPGVRSPDQEATRLLRRAELGREIGRLDIALEALARLEVLVDSTVMDVPGVDLRFDAQLQIGLLRSATGEFHLARAAFDRAMGRLRVLPSDTRAARLHAAIADLDYEAGAAASAFASYDSALASALRAGQIGLADKTRVSLARRLIDAGRGREAEAVLAPIGASLDRDFSYGVWQERTLWLAAAAFAQGHPERAAGLLETLLDEAGADIAPEPKARALILLARCLEARGHADQALARAHEAREFLASQLVAGASPGSDALRHALGDLLREATATLVRLRLSRAEASEALAAETLRQTLEMRALGWGWPRERAALPRELTIALLDDGETGRLWVADQGAASLHATPPADSIRHYARRLRNSLERPARGADTSAARWLANALLSPLRGRWRADQPLQVVDDPLWAGIPWCLLPWEDGMVLDHAPVAVCPWALDAGPPAPGSPARLVSLGYDGAGSEEFPRLKKAEREARAVALRWAPEPATLLTGARAARERLLDAMTAPSGALHLATHARLHRGTTDLAYLLLAGPAGGDDYLYATEIAGRSAPVDLVFLSSCAATGAGAAAFNLDLSKAFLKAGAGAAVASSHLLDDAAGLAFSECFWSAYIAGGRRDPAAALRQAQQRLRDDTGYRDPFFWAHYELQRPWR